MARLLVFPSTSLWPSGADLATLSTPRLPPAPGRLSTSTLQWFCSAIFCATVRAVMSEPLPGGNGTTRRIGLAGKPGRPGGSAGGRGRQRQRQPGGGAQAQGERGKQGACKRGKRKKRHGRWSLWQTSRGAP